MQSLTKAIINNYKIVIIESPKILSKGLLSDIVSDEHADLDVIFLFSSEGKISNRRKEGSPIRCDLIVQKLNGGGHSYAAAGTLKPLETIVTEIRKLGVEDILRILPKVLTC